MNVGDVMQHLTDLSSFLSNSGAKKPARELESLVEAFSPYQSHTITAFCKVLTDKPASAPKAKGPKTPQTSAQVEEIAEQTRRLYNNVTSPSITYDDIDALVSRISSLKVAEIKKVGQAIGYHATARRKNDIVADIREWLVSRKGSFHRAEMVERVPTG